MTYGVIPHAIFSAPQVAGVGKTEDELKSDGVVYRVGRWKIEHTAMGMALKESGLVKILADESGRRPHRRTRHARRGRNPEGDLRL